jgi:hypothetical protein
MAHNLIVKPEAEFELVEAIEWYEEQLPGLGRKLFQELLRSLMKLLKIPNISRKNIATLGFGI